MAESRYMEYVEEEIRRNPSRSAGFYGDSSKGSTRGAKRGISQSYGVKSGIEMPSTGFDPHIFSSGKRTIKDNDPYMQSMIDTIAGVGPRVKGSFGYQIGVMEHLVRVLKAMNQDEKPTLCIIYEAMDREKMAIKVSVRKWEKYWEIIDDRWYWQLHRHLHATEVRQGVKEVIKRLQSDLIVQANAINEIKLFVDKLGEFESPLARQAISTSPPGKGKYISSRQNDSDDETAEDDDNDDDGNNDDDNDGDGNVHKETQQSHGMTLAQEDENYYLTQNKDHGYRPKIENQCRFLFTLTDYPSQGDNSQSQRYGRRQPDIQYSMQNLKIDKQTTPNAWSSRLMVQIVAKLVLEEEIVEVLQIALNMEHVMPPQPLPQYPYNIPYQGVLPQVPYGLPSQPLMYFPYGIPSHSAGVINVGSYTIPYTQNYSPTSHDYYRRIDGDD
ncbi:hypothetical protein Sango_1897000 [Sesamum angolense]|uniref:Uncharacterized protein n=1 Tax=Sesamum angolense TaxID=2727404 RepID=A0AAE2BQN0_9LAMI|nr:hypothetical protein Sango_1897000 [Sesamum angolense]